MTLPPLPEPTIVDNRRLYTAGDMREYGKACFESGMQGTTIAGRAENETPRSAAVDELMRSMGMK